MIRVGVIGAGQWGPNLIANLHGNDRSEVAWVVDRDQDRRAAVTRRFPGIRTSAEPASAIEDASVDAVVVATPTSTHFEIASAALRAKKHVLVEKPIADSVDKAEKLCDLARAADVVLMVGHVFVYNPAAVRAKEYLDAGSLGRVYYLSMVRTNLGPIRVDVNAAWDLAAHDVSLANYWLGGHPSSVSAVGGAWINGGIEDAVFATLRYPGDVLVNVHCSWLNPRKSRDITIVGDKRMLTFDDTNLLEPLRVYDKHVTDERTSRSYVDSFGSYRMSVRDGDIVIPKVTAGEPLKLECQHFLDCIESRSTPRSSGEDGAAVVRALSAISRSLREHGSEQSVGS